MTETTLRRFVAAEIRRLHEKAIKMLAQGDVDVNEPYGELDAEIELEGTNESIDLRRWNRLAGLLRD